MKTEISLQPPSIAEYNELRHLAGWPTFERDQVEVALRNSLSVATARDETGLLIGMGRVVGDGAIYLHIQDVIVRPGFQRKGVGKMIMAKLLEYVESTAGKNTNVGLMCSKGREEFYKTFGFVERPNQYWGAGMLKVLSS